MKLQLLSLITCTVTICICMAMSLPADHPQQISSVRIGNQIWMDRNLDLTQFRNGDIIPEAKSAKAWIKAVEERKPAWCYLENKSANGATYGKLYNWYAVIDKRGLAPRGWHIPSKQEWDALATAIKHDDEALKSATQWRDNCSSKPEKNGTNTTGFNALQGGFRDNSGEFSERYSTGFWSATRDREWDEPRAYIYRLSCDRWRDNGLAYGDWEQGFYVRCIKD